METNEILIKQYLTPYNLIIGLFSTSNDAPFDSSGTDCLIYMAIKKAEKAILKYTGWTEMQEGYDAVLADLALAYLSVNTEFAKVCVGSPLISQQSQGSRSATYKVETAKFDSNGLTPDVKAALPLPPLRVF